MTVGVVGESDLATRVADAVRDADGTVERGTAATVLDADPSVVVAPGEPAVLDAVRAGTSVPVLAVAAGPELASVPESDVEEAVADLLADEWSTTERPLLSVRIDGERVARALYDAMLVTSEAARISEYAVRTSHSDVDQFRADGVVVATPTGSTGYAYDAGGPAVEPETDVLSVVPVAPFAIHLGNWVLSGPVTLSVERDDGEVSLYADDRKVAEVPPRTPVELAYDGAVELVTVEGSRRFFE
ncbi:ATP-NAD kinase [Halomicrococcus sp. SG-WS-1]|uniref:ATP-NAD kinase n=1 Tax=Halomicrococcus sp. SG-WS-1 TaxID=3439057 RepID=UPI003F7A288D